MKNSKKRFYFYLLLALTLATVMYMLTSESGGLFLDPYGVFKD